jgi:hypothetical protein
MPGNIPGAKTGGERLLKITNLKNNLKTNYLLGSPQ